MNRRLLAMIAATVVIAACSDNGEQSPTGPALGGRPSLAASDGSCSFSDLKNYAKNLFGNGSAGHQLANQMGTFTAGSTQATNIGFDLFAAIAAKRNDPTDFTSAQIDLAANLTGEIIDCSTMSASGSTTVAAFAAALGSTGAYEVRGNTTKDGDTPVITADGLSGVNKASGETFQSWLGKRTLFYGSPTQTFSSETSSGRAYDWSIIQPGATLGALSKPALVSICIEFDDTIDEIADFRVEHQGDDVETILPLDASFLTCPATLPTANSTISARLIRLLAPTPLYALGKLTTSPTGNAGSFSPFEVVDPEALVATYVSAPLDAKKNQVIPGTDGAVAVQITGAGETAWQGVTVTVFGVNNNGDKVAFSGNVAVTDKNGIASYPNLKTNKTGSYLLRAETQETNQGSTSFTQVTILTNKKFNVRP